MFGYGVRTRRFGAYFESAREEFGSASLARINDSFSSIGLILRVFNFAADTAVVAGVVGGAFTPVGGVAEGPVSSSKELWDELSNAVCCC